MNRLNFTILLTLLLGTVSSQGNQYTDFPEGVYFTHQDFLDKRATIIPKMRKVNICPGCNPMADSIVDHCYFINEGNDIIKKAFAFSHKGELYFQHYGIRNNLAERSFLGIDDDVRFCYRVLEKGRYLYTELAYPMPGGVASGMLTTWGVNAGPTYLKSIVAYDYSKNGFITVHNCAELKKFLKNNCPGKELDCPESRPKFLMEVRNLFKELNTSE